MKKVCHIFEKFEVLVFFNSGKQVLFLRKVLEKNYKGKSFLGKNVPLNFLYGSSIVTENLNMGSMCLTNVLYQDLLWIASIIQIFIFTYSLFLDCTMVLFSFFQNLNISWCVHSPVISTYFPYNRYVKEGILPADLWSIKYIVFVHSCFNPPYLFLC